MSEQLIHSPTCNFTNIWEFKYPPSEHFAGLHDCDCSPMTYEDLEKRANAIISRRRETSYRHIFLTISLPTNSKMSQIGNHFDPAIIKISGVYHWTYEFYGSNLQLNPHIHLLVKTDAKLDKKRIIKRLAKYFHIKENFVDYIYSPSSLLYKKRLNYICGDKTSSKEKQIILDEEMRIKLKLKSHYTL